MQRSIRLLSALKPLVVEQAIVPVEQAVRDVTMRSQLTQQIQASERAMIGKELTAMQAETQTLREWIRAHRRTNGSMLPHEHHHALPPGIGTVHIHASKNNTILTVTDCMHKVLGTVSGGMCGLKGAHRSTTESGIRSASRIAALTKEKGIADVVVAFRGFGQGREAAFRTLLANGLRVVRVIDRTPIPHGGCRPKKARRV